MNERVTQSLHGSFTFDGVGVGVGVAIGVGVGVGVAVEVTLGDGVGDGIGVGVTDGVADLDPGQVCESRIPELVVFVAAKVPL